MYLYHHGYLPENYVDHINRDKLDNRIENLREVSKSCSSRNVSQQSHTASGVKGVAWSADEGRWKSSIDVAGRKIFLGYSSCLLEAACLRLAAEQAEGWQGCESSSPAFLYVKENLGCR